MKSDKNILIGIFFCGVLGYFANSNEQILPLAILGLGLSIFYLERCLIGRSLSFSALTLPSFFILGFLIILFMPLVSLWEITEGNAKYIYLYALFATLVTFPIGVLFANLTTNNSLSGYGSENQQIIPSNDDRRFVPVFLSLLFVSFVVLVIFFIYSTRVQLIDLLFPGTTIFDEIEPRFAQIELPKVVQYIFEVARRVLLPVCLLYAYFMKYFHGGMWKRIFPIVLIASLIVSLLTLDRSPPLGLLAMLATAYFIVRKGTGRLRWFVIISIVVSALLIAGIVSIFQYQNESISIPQIFQVAWYVATVRIFESPVIMATRAFDTYNYDTNFLYGEYVRLFSFLPGVEYVESVSDADPLVAAPVTFVGDLWRNWGWPGVVLGAFLFGLVFQLIQVSIFNKKTIARASIYVLLLWGSLAILHGNAFGVVTLSVIIFGAGLGIAARRFERR